MALAVSARTPRPRPRGAEGAALVLLAVLAGGTTHAWETGTAPRLHPGAIELGLAGSLSAIEGSASATLRARVGSFFSAGPLLAEIEPELGYRHVHDLDEMDLEIHLGVERRLGRSVLYASAALGGGVRQEWLGSFREARVPLGAGVGLRALVDPRAAARLEYRFRRVLHDPVADFSEHEVLVGLSILFRNSR